MKYIKYQIFVVITFLCVSASVNAQNVDKIIDKHIKAHGDIDKWESFKNIEIKGRFTAFSVEEDFYAIKTNNGEYYSELSLGQHKVTEAFDGKKGWTIDPWHDFIFPRELNKSEVNVFQQKAEFFTPFYKYKERGLSVELLENQNVDGMEMFVIKLIRPDDKVETWYLSASTYLEYKCESGWVDFAYPAAAESYFDDFREVNGIIIPFFIERTFFQRDRITQIESVEFNVDFDKNLLEIPQSEEIKKLAFLEGEWDVKVDVWSRRGSWYTIDSTVSTITWKANNMLQETIAYDQTYVIAKTLNYTYNSTIEDYVISVYNGFSSDLRLFQGNFNDSSFLVTNINIDYGDTTAVKRYTQFSYGEINDDSFILEVKTSPDNGVSWNPRMKFEYVRRESIGLF